MLRLIRIERRDHEFIVCFRCIQEMIPYSKGRLKIITNPLTPEDAVISVNRSEHFKAWLAGRG